MLNADLAETVYDRSDLPIADFYNVTDFDLRKRGNEVFFNVSLAMDPGTTFDVNTIYSIGPEPISEELRPIGKNYHLNGFGCDSNWGIPTALTVIIEPNGYIKYAAPSRSAFFKLSGTWFTD